MAKLDYLHISGAIMAIKDITPVQKMLLGLAESLPEGLKLSNAALAEFLGTSRRNVVRHVQRLRKEGYLVDEGTEEQHRILRVSSDKLSPVTPLTSDKLSPVTPLTSDKLSPVTPLTSDKLSPVTAPTSDKLSPTSDKLSPVTSDKLSPIIKDLTKVTKKRLKTHVADKTSATFAHSEKLARLLFNLITKRKPDYKKPDLKKWAAEVGRMIRIDHRKPENIEAVIRWAQADSGNGDNWQGWQAVILSPKKLRAKFDKLEMLMTGAKHGTDTKEIKPGGHYR